MDDGNLTPAETPQETSDRVAEKVFHIAPDLVSRANTIRQFLLGAAQSAILIPALFYLRFHEVGALGWGTTVFFVVYCLLSALGLYFRSRTDFHTPVPLRGDWLDRIGAFWLVACVFGPFLGWILTSGVIPITADSWRWLYGARVFLAVCLPLLTALPLTRYAQGKSAWIAIPLLVIITLLPISTAMTVSQDLWEGPVMRSGRAIKGSDMLLRHTGQRLGGRQ